MTKRQSQTLEKLRCALTPVAQEAVKSLKDERTAYAAWAESWLYRYYGPNWSPLMLEEAMAELRAIHAKATGGQS